MNKDDNIFCVANSYTKSYWLSPDFANLPKSVKEELQALSVIFTEDVGGLLVFRFEGDKLIIDIRHDEKDYYFDEIGAGLRVRKLMEDKEELFSSLELFYKMIVR